jgi:hypothetical protein
VGAYATPPVRLQVTAMCHMPRPQKCIHAMWQDHMSTPKRLGSVCGMWAAAIPDNRAQQQDTLHLDTLEHHTHHPGPDLMIQ